MRSTRQPPISVAYLEILIQRALDDLREARRVGDAYRTRQAARRMNALLDQLAKHI